MPRILSTNWEEGQARRAPPERDDSQVDDSAGGNSRALSPRVEWNRVLDALIRAVTGCMHSNRLPGSKEPHCAHACSSIPQRVPRLSRPTSPSMTGPHCVPNDLAHIDVAGPCCECRCAPAGAHQFRILRDGRAGSRPGWTWTTVVAWNFADLAEESAACLGLLLFSQNGTNRRVAHTQTSTMSVTRYLETRS